MRKYVPWHKLKPQTYTSAGLKIFALVFLVPFAFFTYWLFAAGGMYGIGELIWLVLGSLSLACYLVARRIERRERSRR